jgi:hypothetical protein
MTRIEGLKISINQSQNQIKVSLKTKINKIRAKGSNN